MDPWIQRNDVVRDYCYEEVGIETVYLQEDVFDEPSYPQSEYHGI